eukprot:gene8478-10789_t
MPQLPPLTKALILACVGVYFLFELVPGAGWFALWPLQSGNFMPWQPLSYAFLHGGFTHLLFNMLGLWMFGSELERVWGRRRYAQLLIAGALTEIAGSSAVVDRGFVTYSNDAKIQMLGVDPATLAAHGAVSRQTAVEMARGAVSRSEADFAVAVTGIAGPGGGSAEKPVGLVHLSATGRTGTALHREMRYGDIGRDAVRL